MISRLLLAGAPLIALFPSSLHAEPAAVGEAQLRRHIEVLASDAYEGRKPGTEGENRTLLYIASQFQAIGLEPAAGDERYYQPVPLVERIPFAHRSVWTGAEGAVAVGDGDILLSGEEARETIAGAPVVLAGYGLPSQLAGADLRGAVVLMLRDAPDGVDAPAYPERAKAAAAAGAVAVIAILARDARWAATAGAQAKGQTRLADDRRARVSGSLAWGAAETLVRAGGGTLSDAGDPTFRPRRLGLDASLDVSTRVRSTRVRPYRSHNVIGRLRGSGATGESVVYLGHWDHLGICRPADAEDRICNGAVDNASGIAMLIETARALAAGPRPVRDILFMGTTAEEMGLLGAEYFAAHPPVPLASLVAAVNIDTVAIAPAGAPVAIVGRGTTPLDPVVDATARALGRAVDSDLEANAFIERQDGWALARAGVPSVMVGGSFANMKRLGAFLGGPYHQPGDDLGRPIELGGAAEDTALMVALGRRLADPARYRPSGR